MGICLHKSCVIGALNQGSKRMPRGMPRGKRANGEHSYSLRIGDSPQLAAENLQLTEVNVSGVMLERDSQWSSNLDSQIPHRPIRSTEILIFFTKE